MIRVVRALSLISARLLNIPGGKEGVLEIESKHIVSDSINFACRMKPQQKLWSVGLGYASWLLVHIDVLGA